MEASNQDMFLDHAYCPQMPGPAGNKGRHFHRMHVKPNSYTKFK